MVHSSLVPTRFINENTAIGLSVTAFLIWRGTLMLGEIFAILTALMWAASTVLSAEALKRVDPVRSNTIKTFFSALTMLPIAIATGELNSLPQVDLEALFLIVLAAIVGFGVGDILLFKSIILTGVSRAYTIAYTYPLFTMIIAVLFLKEPFLLRYLIGTILIVLSVIMTSLEDSKNYGKISLEGLMIALAAALCWAIGTILAALGLKGISVLLANTIRYPVLSLFLFLISRPRKKWKIGKKDLGILSASGILGMVLGGITFLFSIQFIGASRATPLSASSPVWASIMSSIISKERVTIRLLLSSIIVSVGICFLV